MSAILIGYRGSGKTTLGRRLADRLWNSFIDADEWIVKTAGKTIRQIFADHGEPHFRDLETQAIHHVCTLQDHIIALGGGAILRPENRLAIKESGFKCIYLRCDPAVLFEHINADPTTSETRPNLTHAGGIHEIVTLLAQREPLYREAMTAELDVTNLSPQDAVVYLSRMI